MSKQMEIPYRILIVDHNQSDLLSLKNSLSRMPVRIDMAISGLDAIQLAKANRYLLVVSDIQMAEVDGFETVRHLRELPQHQFTPIILISAFYSEDQKMIQRLQAGTVDFMLKPVNLDILRAKVQVFIDLEEIQTRLNSAIEELQIKNNLLTAKIEKCIQTARELEIAKAKAEMASEFNSRLLVNMSHEIRTPVNSILGFADLITNPAVADKDKEQYMKYVSSSSQNLLFLIDEILAYSSLEAGELKISLVPVEIISLCSELLDYFQTFKLQSGKEGISLKLEIDSQISDLYVITDNQRLRQILSNLIDNALKYTSAGSIEFGFFLRETEIDFFVKDSGIGIATEDIAEIFDRFKRADNRFESGATGTGIGLSISKNLVELLGGKIRVKSELGKGSEFRFTIPFIAVDVRSDSKARPFKMELPDKVDWIDKTILIAEDEELNFKFLRECLRVTGIKVLWAKTGRESIDLVSGHPEINLVLMDIRMPDIDGYQATRLIKSIRPELPIVIQTAYAIPDEKNKGIREVGDEFITKPINRLHLLKTISVYFDQ